MSWLRKDGQQLDNAHMRSDGTTGLRRCLARVNSAHAVSGVGRITAAPTSSLFSWDIGNQTFFIGNFLDGT